MPPQPLFDRLNQARFINRALARGYLDMLLARASEDLFERLSLITRHFPLALTLGDPVGHVAQTLRKLDAIDTLIDAVPTALTARQAPGSLTVAVDEETLPFKSESLSLIVSLLSLHGVNDLPGSLIQIRRALHPDGLFMGCLLGGETLTELRQSFIAAESELENGVSPRVAPFADVRDVGGLLQRAGFALPVTDVERVTVRYDNAFVLMKDLRAMGLANALTARRKTFSRRATLLRMAEIYSERFSDADGRIRATFDLLWLSGWAPHESQQKPLRPGSAKMRLADVLNKIEK